MPVHFKMTPKKNIMVSPPEIKYYPCAVSQGEVDLNHLSKIIASRCSMSKADCFGVVMALSEVLGESLSEGRIVKIDNLGSFQLSLSGTPADTTDELGKTNIKKAKINFKPAKELNKRLRDIVYKRVR
jgi:predicted histone-like DNA-binding protein